MTSLADQPVPLSLPSILVNQRSKSAAQIEAFNVQQREKAAAAASRRAASHKPVGTGSGVGKRILRRRENATFQANPHIQAPSKTDLFPSPPPHRPSFPLPVPHNSAKTPLGPALTGSQHPDPSSSAAGTYTTSLKGVRKALRGRGRRAEVVVLEAEKEIREWKAGVGWKVIDETLVEPEEVYSGSPPSSSPGQGQGVNQRRKLPHAPPLSIPPFLSSPSSNPQGTPAIIALAQTPAHQIWHIPDAFDRWLVHLVCRYWQLVSWSEVDAESGLRVTHLVRPEIALVRASAGGAVARGGTSGNGRGLLGGARMSGLMTPETTDLSASGSEATLSSTEAETETDTEIDTDALVESDDEVEHDDHDTTFCASSPAPAPTPTHTALQRTQTQDSEDYLYPASDEGDWSDGESLSGALGDSLVLEDVSLDGTDGGWRTVVGAPPPRFGVGVGAVETQKVGVNGGRMEEKMSFFDYLYGA